MTTAPRRTRPSPTGSGCSTRSRRSWRNGSRSSSGWKPSADRGDGGRREGQRPQRDGAQPERVFHAGEEHLMRLTPGLAVTVLSAAGVMAAPPERRGGPPPPPAPGEG